MLEYLTSHVFSFGLYVISYIHVDCKLHVVSVMCSD